MDKLRQIKVLIIREKKLKNSFNKMVKMIELLWVLVVMNLGIS